MSSDDALIAEIERLSGAIDRHKSKPQPQPTYAPRFHQPRNTFVNPAYPHKKYINPALTNKTIVNPPTAKSDKPAIAPASSSSSTAEADPNASRELVVNGVAFESSTRKLVRKDLVKPELTGSASTSRPRAPYVRKGGNLVAGNRVHKPKFSKRKPLGGRNNMVLDNIKGIRTGKIPKQRRKNQIDKQCRFFTMTGVCQRGLTCPYQHDAEKIAICPQFLSRNCPNTEDTCHLSHDPTPNRVPLCHHFQNHGRCTRQDCPYPHIRVGKKDGICRDFAVLGYCDKGIDCDKQHLRECPDFAEKGVCPTKGCRLPHVIRANRRRQPATVAVATTAARATNDNSTTSSGGLSVLSSAGPVAAGTEEEYIALTFEESEDEEEAEDEGEESSEEEASEEEEEDDAPLDVHM
ncbi:hypothetical protein M422DRAFT_23848 [Sphaerobolus stellatus SS14]|nr:hypothetical protein M422DRAFT_23848 [Sphaerobolus stellatus SS14]